MIPAFLKKLMFSLTKLPNIGRKNAEKLTLFLIENPKIAQELMASIENTLDSVEICQTCFAYKEKETICQYCQAPNRDFSKLCVVEQAQDILNIEKTGFNGIYHVLQGIISPINGVAIENIRFAELKNRLKNGQTKELIFALSPSIEAEATILEIKEQLHDFQLEIYTLAQGVPAGFGIEYVDQYTLQRAIEEKRKLN